MARLTCSAALAALLGSTLALPLAAQGGMPAPEVMSCDDYASLSPDGQMEAVDAIVEFLEDLEAGETTGEELVSMVSEACTNDRGSMPVDIVREAITVQ